MRFYIKYKVFKLYNEFKIIAIIEKYELKSQIEFYCI